MSTHDRDDAAPPSNPRDPALERAWHVASVEQPPDGTDARILAAARVAIATSQVQSTATQTRVRPWRAPARWHSLLAAAAVAGLAFVLVPRTANLPPRDLEVPSSQRQESVAAPAEFASSPDVDATSNETSAGRPAPAAQARATARARPPAPAPSPSRDDASLRSKSTIPPPPAAAAEGAAGVPDTTTGAAAAYGESGVERSNAAKAADAGEAPRAVAVPAPQASSRERSGEGDARTVDAAAWAARIEALHAAGELVAAARELQAFRAAVPDAEMHLSPSLRDWARTVP